MNKINSLKKKRDALHLLNANSVLSLGEIDQETNDYLCSLGAKRMTDGIGRSTLTREAEAKDVIGDLITKERDRLYSKMIAIATLIASVIAAIAGVLTAIMQCSSYSD